MEKLLKYPEKMKNSGGNKKEKSRSGGLLALALHEY
jgi:hypothetical protein